MRNDIPVNQLRALLRYEPETGFLYWKERPASLFADTAERRGIEKAADIAEGFDGGAGTNPWGWPDRIAAAIRQIGETT